MAQKRCSPPPTPRSATAKYYHGQINILVHEVKTWKQVNRKFFTAKESFAAKYVPQCEQLHKLIDRKNLFVAKNSSVVGMFVFLTWKIHQKSPPSGGVL